MARRWVCMACAGCWIAPVAVSLSALVVPAAAAAAAAAAITLRTASANRVLLRVLSLHG